LTTDAGKDDGPDYSPDGKYIYFNSDRTGHMQVWRMLADGFESGTNHDRRIRQRLPASFAGRAVDCVLQLSARGGGSSGEQDVMLRLMPAAGGAFKFWARCFGGQGTINVNSWAPNSRNVAYVSYLPF